MTVLRRGRLANAGAKGYVVSTYARPSVVLRKARVKTSFIHDSTRKVVSSSQNKSSNSSSVVFRKTICNIKDSIYLEELKERRVLRSDGGEGDSDEETTYDFGHKRL